MLVCDHAGRHLPRALGDLGVPPAALERHVAYDLGIEPVALALSEMLDAPLVRQTYSRLVVDCNRPPAVPASMPVLSERTRVPGNEHLTDAQRSARLAALFHPYHDAIAGLLDARARDFTAMVALHSFTPVYNGIPRPWHCGLLHRDARLATPLLALLRAEPGLVVGDNQPYSVDDVSDYTIPVHGERRGILHVGIELRQDLLADEGGRRAWAERLARLLPEALG